MDGNGNGLPLFTFRGQRDDSLIYHARDGYYFHVVNKRRDRRFTYLRCIRYGRLDSCTGSAKALLRERLLFHLSDHNHEGNIYYPDVVALRSQVVRRIKRGDLTSNDEILHEEGRRFPMQVRAQLPLATVESGLNKIRGILRPRVPNSLLELGLQLMQPQYWHLTQLFGEHGSLFSGICGSTLETISIVFISNEMKQFMITRDVVFADGTERKKFKKPANSQIFTINGVWGSHGIPMLRAIMARRTEAAYVALFDYLKLIMPEFRPSMIMCDYEEAEFNAFKACFPQATVTGCLWHYAVAILRHAKVNLGLQPLVRNEEEVASTIRAACALPLLPSHEIADGLIDLGDEAVEKGWMNELRPFFQYIDREWVPKADMLSVYEAAHRTNNVSESGNKTLNKALKVSSPGCFRVISVFRDLHEKALTELESIRLNLRVVRKRKISVLRNDRSIKQACQELENGDITRLEFLHKTSRRLQNVFMKTMNLPRVAE